VFVIFSFDCYSLHITLVVVDLFVCTYCRLPDSYHRERVLFFVKGYTAAQMGAVLKNMQSQFTHVIICHCLLLPVS